MKIQNAKKSDYKSIAKLIVNELAKHPYKEHWTEKSAVKTINFFLKIKGKIFVAVIYEKVVGFILFREESYNQGKSIMVEELIVDSHFQGKGIGSALINYAEKYCKKNKIKTINLMTAKNAHAFGFYKKLGYKNSRYTVLMRKKLK